MLSRDDENLVRHAWREAHPLPPYLRRRFAPARDDVVGI